MPTHHSYRNLLPIGIVFGMVALAPFGSSAAESNSASARAAHACGMILGLSKSEAPYEACVRSLDATASNPANAVALANPPPMMIRIACGDLGLEPDTPSFDQCEANLRQSLFNLSNVGAR